MTEQYFLGANSAEGFVSKFAESYNIEEGYYGFIIKGGAGTGKSSLMRRIAGSAEKKGYSVVLCPCSSDPDSLDGVIIKEKKFVFLDGTSPHIVEPRMAGAGDSIINLGEFWDRGNLLSNKQEIIRITKENKTLHKTASAYLQSAGKLMNINLDICKLNSDAEKIVKEWCNIIPKKQFSKRGIEWERFLTGITPKGIISYPETVTAFYDNIYIISDNIGTVSKEIMLKMRETALENGYEVITLFNPFLPSKIIDHILIPELNTAFLTENSFIKFDTNINRISAEKLCDYEKIRETAEMNIEKANELLVLAALTLERAKSVHDELEKLYIPAMDFEKVNAYTKELIEKIL